MDSLPIALYHCSTQEVFATPSPVSDQITSRAADFDQAATGGGRGPGLLWLGEMLPWPRYAHAFY
jgi:hypothetical protein